MEFAQLRKMDWNEPVSITMPAHAWLGFMAAYGSTRWKCGPANAIATLAREALLDPEYLAQEQAEHDQEVEEHQAVMARFGMVPPDSAPAADAAPASTAYL